MWVQDLHNSGRTSLVLLFSSRWVTHTVVMGFDFIMIAPSYLVTTASCLSLDMGYLFLVGSGILLSTVVQQLVAILVLSQEMSTHPSTLPSYAFRLPWLLHGWKFHSHIQGHSVHRPFVPVAASFSYSWPSVPTSLSSSTDAQQMSLHWHSAKNSLIFSWICNMKGTLWFEAWSPHSRYIRT